MKKKVFTETSPRSQQDGTRGREFGAPTTLSASAPNFTSMSIKIRKSYSIRTILSQGGIRFTLPAVLFWLLFKRSITRVNVIS